MDLDKKGILLVNLGTPEAATLPAVYRYLVEFLTDPRVIDFSWLKRQLLVRGIIIPFRLKASTQSYQKIWMNEGSPLMVYSQQAKHLLQEQLGNSYSVKLAMRYQTPSIETAIDQFIKEGIGELIVLPLFPQYASATTGSIFEKVTQVLSRYPTIPSFKFISSFYNDPGFIEAQRCVACEYLIEDYDKILFSFHGLPKRQLKNSDCQGICLKSELCCVNNYPDNRLCYSAECYATAREIAQAIGLEKDQYLISFQSRLGKDPWQTPYTIDTLETLAKQGVKKVLVFCPAFVCDCLETIYEIGTEYQHLFKEAGGEKLTLVPSLNAHPAWIEALRALVVSETSRSPLALQPKQT